MSELYLIEELYQQAEQERYRMFLQSLSSSARFEDDTWICDKRNQSKGQELYKVSIYYSKVADRYKEMMKYFVILRLLDGISVTTVKHSVYIVSNFLYFLEDKPLSEITLATVAEFKQFLQQESYAPRTLSKYFTTLDMFFRKMNGFEGMILKNPFHGQTVMYDRLVDSKYIPEFVAKQLDVAFMDENIPVTLRTIYWVLRLVPSRISEVLAMELHCVKPFDEHFVLTIPTFKQNGGYKEGIPRLIHLEEEGIGAYLLDLLKKQQKESGSVQKMLPKDNRNALFGYQSCRYEDGDYFPKKYYLVATQASVSYQLKKLCKIYQIKDEKGEIYQVTSHQFRHNGVTDRLRAGFTLPQIAEMTAHHGRAMLQASYTHLNLYPESLIEPLVYDSEDNHPFVLFKGRILNMDPITEAKILKNLRSHRIPGGICVDVTHCASGMWDCISCQQFVPEQEQQPYFKEQGDLWQAKAEKFQQDKQMHDNFKELAKSFHRLAAKLQEGEDYS